MPMNVRKIKAGNVNTTIVLFSTTGSGYLQIWTVTYNEATDTAGTPTMLYNRNMGVSRNNRIKAYGIYESSKYQRVYFADALNPLRTFNIANVDSLYTNNGLTTKLNLVNLVLLL